MTAEEAYDDCIESVVIAVRRQQKRERLSQDDTDLRLQKVATGTMEATLKFLRALKELRRSEGKL